MDKGKKEETTLFNGARMNKDHSLYFSVFSAQSA